jgi:hypothetical protein
MHRMTRPFAHTTPRVGGGAHWISVGCFCMGLAAGQLSGCATSDDPREGGFVNGIIGLGGGGYQRRLDEREAILSAERAEQRRLAIEQQEVEAERDAVRRELNRAQQRLAAQQQRIAAEQSRIRALRRQSAADRARLAKLDQAKKRASSLSRTIEGADPAREPLRGLEAKTRNINREIDQIADAVGIISGV